MNHFKLNFKIGKYHHLLFLSILFGNFWIWRILREDLILGILLLILSFLLFIVVSSKFFMSQQIAIIFLIIIISSLTLKVGFDKNIFITSPEEQLQQNFRHGLYSIELGQLFTNKYGQNYYKYFSGPINKLQRNFFSNLDFILYFRTIFGIAILPKVRIIFYCDSNYQYIFKSCLQLRTCVIFSFN